MSFRLTYEEILEMVRDTVLNTGVARDIIRRAGIRFGGAGVLGDLFARFGYRSVETPPPDDSMEVLYEEQTSIPYFDDQTLPVGSTHLVKTTDNSGVQIEQDGYYRVQASMICFIAEMDVPWVIQVIACARDAEFNILRQVLLDEQYFSSEPHTAVFIGDEEHPDLFFSTAWWAGTQPHMNGQNIIQANAGEVLTIDLLIHFLRDPTTTEGEYEGLTVIGVEYAMYRQWIELLNPPIAA